jgi:hypothetical protein
MCLARASLAWGANALRRALAKTARDLDKRVRDSTFGWGLVNAKPRCEK